MASLPHPRGASRRLPLVLLFLAVWAAYANHFHNSFHFDDSHVVQDNPGIRSLSNIPRFFRDTTLSTVLPANRTWRPLVTASLAIDYWMGGGLNTFAFHLSTFLWYLVLLWLVFRLAWRMFDHARPSQDNQPFALLAAAVYGLHPVCAETVNYIAQRGDLYSTLGSVAGLYLYSARPEWRKYAIYLLPVFAGQLSKAPALVFPLLLLLYIRGFEDRSWDVSLRRAAPALFVTAASALLQAQMTPRNFSGGASSPWLYRITQPFVAARYFSSFFLPTHLSADTDFTAFSSATEGLAIVGYLFLAGIVLAAALSARRRTAGPIGFGLSWFLLTLAPTSIYPLAEVENDHRMFFPFVGLSIAVTWAAASAWDWLAAKVVLQRQAAIVSACVVLVAAGYGTHVRNEVWKDEASLWRDVTIKSPRNGRGLMNYGLTFMAAGQYHSALDYFQRALVLMPNYSTLEINLGVVMGSLHRDAEAEAHFQRAIALAPGDNLPYYFYARWLNNVGQFAKAIPLARTSVQLNPSYLDAAALLVQLANGAALRAARVGVAEKPSGDVLTPEAYLNLSLSYFQAKKYKESIRAARDALNLRPNYAEAYNNIAAAYEEMQQWDAAILNAREALRLTPDFALARNNLAWAEAEKAKAAGRK